MPIGNDHSYNTPFFFTAAHADSEQIVYPKVDWSENDKLLWLPKVRPREIHSLGLNEDCVRAFLSDDDATGVLVVLAATTR